MRAFIVAGMIVVSSAMVTPANLEPQGNPVSAYMQRRANAEGLKWQHSLPSIGTPSSTVCPLATHEPSSIFDGSSTSSHGDYFECTIHKDGCLAGRILFNTAGQNEDEQGVLMLERLLGARCLEVQHIDVDAKLRGHGGGKLLMRLMLAALDAESRAVPFVMLNHLERNDIAEGTGHLVNWYRSMGFETANDVIPHAAAGKLFHPHDMVASHADLSRHLCPSGAAA